MIPESGTNGTVELYGVANFRSFGIKKVAHPREQSPGRYVG